MIMRIKYFFLLIENSLKLFIIFLLIVFLLIFLSGIDLTAENIALLLTLNYVPRNMIEAIVQVVIMLLELSPLMAFVEMITFSEENKAEAKAKCMRNHIVVVGCGHLGKRIVNFLIKMKIPFVLIVRPEDKIENEVVIALLKKGFPIIFGDAMVAETLEKANIKNACAIIIAINNDMINPIIAQKAKKLNPKIRTVVRIFDDSLAEVLRKSPYIDEVISTTDTAYRFFVFGACFDVAPEERLITFNVNKKLAGVKIDNLEKLGIEIVALKRNGKWIKPKSETTLKHGDKIVVVGDIESLSNFMKKFLMS